MFNAVVTRLADGLTLENRCGRIVSALELWSEIEASILTTEAICSSNIEMMRIWEANALEGINSLRAAAVELRAVASESGC